MDYIYVGTLEPDDDVVDAELSELKHLDVLRIRDGDVVGVLNGRGLISTCRVSRVGGRISLHTESRRVVAKPPSLTIVIGLLDNRDRWEFAVEKVTELGVTNIVPLICDRVQRRKFSRHRMNQKIVAALKQSGNAWLPRVSEPVVFSQQVDVLKSFSRVIVGDADGDAPTVFTETDNVAIVIGPEGGFSAQETNQLAQLTNTVVWRIGSNRLRSETAAISLLAAYHSHFSV
ncbi:MAG: 16S rRNA (uracil(1498)-N(3))-methyltransferase [Ignavibacteria bacterium]|nr:16S rRNA (uracil(1498)-N(3))-methyltransferase [Ignavibacteria bacterium]